jgi:hypothetical protein
MGNQFHHMNLLHQTADLASQLGRCVFDDGVMRDSLDLALGPVQGDFTTAAFLATGICPNLTPPCQILLLIFFAPGETAQKLTCTRMGLSRKNSHLHLARSLQNVPTFWPGQ